MSKPKRNPLDRNRLRMWGYYGFGTVGIGVTYAIAKGVIGQDELVAWSSLCTLFGFTAGSKVDLGQPPRH